MKISKQCKMCRKIITMEVSEEGYEMYLAGARVQDAFPKMSEDDRELLISGICGPCFDKLFAEDEDEEDDSGYEGEVYNSKKD